MARRFEERSYTLEQYFELERNSDEKHEFYQGQIYLMSGGTPYHSLIASNIARNLGNTLKKPCKVFNSDLQVYVKSNGLVTYPDVSVICGSLDYAKEERNAVTNPVIIVEVLSPSTARYDEKTKFNLYKGLDSFEDYLLADSREMNVTYYHKIGPNQWVQEIYTKPQDEVVIRSKNVVLTLEQIYDQVEFDPEPIPLRPTENS